MKKRIIGIVLLILLAIIVSGMIFGPFIARIYVNNNGKELIGRTLTIEKVRINYFTSTVRLIGFNLFEKDDTSLFVGFDTLLIDLQPRKLLKSELVVKRLWLTDPVAQIVQRDTVFNFSDIIYFLSASDTTVVKDTVVADSDFKFEFSDIRLKGGNISYTDEIINNTTHLNNLTFTIPYLSWNQDEASEAGLKFNFRNGGYFAALGSFDPGSGEFNAKIIVNELDISQFTAYIKPHVFLNSIEGSAGCELNFNGNADMIDSLRVEGRILVKEFAAFDNNERKILGAENLKVSLNPTLPLAGRYIVDSISLIRPYLLFEMHDSSNNFIELFPPAQPDTVTSEQAEGESISDSLVYSVNSVIINDGVIDFSDITLDEPFNYHLSQIALKTDSVSSKSSWLQAISTMRLNERGDLRAEIGVNPSDPYELKVDYVISNFRLPDFSPYSKFYLGSAIIYGNMYYEGKTTITARQITSENNLVIRNAEIGKKSGGILNIPLRLALYLIKDLNGDIKINMPVRGNLNDPEIKIGRLIWTTFKNLIFKIAATPFIALSDIFGFDENDLKGIDFDYSDTLLTATNTKRLDQLLYMKENKKELDIELVYFNDKNLERDQIGLHEAGNIFRRQTGKSYLEDKDNFEEFLKSYLGKDTIDLYNDCIEVAGAQKIDSILKSREDLRIRLVDDYLKSRDSLSRISIFLPAGDAVYKAGSKPGFEMKFSIEE